MHRRSPNLFVVKSHDLNLLRYRKLFISARTGVFVSAFTENCCFCRFLLCTVQQGHIMSDKIMCAFVLNKLFKSALITEKSSSLFYVNLGLLINQLNKDVYCYCHEL
jgi:hypothetical protein